MALSQKHLNTTCILKTVFNCKDKFPIHFAICQGFEKFCFSHAEKPKTLAGCGNMFVMKIV